MGLFDFRPRLKKYGRFNVHINCVYSPENGAPLTVEIQLIPRGVCLPFREETLYPRRHERLLAVAQAVSDRARAERRGNAPLKPGRQDDIRSFFCTQTPPNTRAMPSSIICYIKRPTSDNKYYYMNN